MLAVFLFHLISGTPGLGGPWPRQSLRLWSEFCSLGLLGPDLGPGFSYLALGTVGPVGRNSSREDPGLAAVWREKSSLSDLCRIQQEVASYSGETGTGRSEGWCCLKEGGSANTTATQFTGGSEADGRRRWRLARRVAK